MYLPRPDLWPCVRDFRRTRHGSQRGPPAASPHYPICILGGIDLPAAAALLCQHSTHPDWLVRYHVVCGLGRRTDRASVEVVEAAVTDPERMIRDEAARWVQRRDPEAAGVLYQRLLDDPGLPAGLRPELARRMSTAKRLATVKRRSVTVDDPEENPRR
jgi:HEAT repeat protein